MDPAKVSVIIPVYNTESYLPECIESLLNQTYPFFEIICVDDGSTDRSAQIIEAYAAEDLRVTLIRQQNSFAGTARNRGMDQAQGKYLLFLDSDDYFDPRMLELSVSRAEETAADIVVFGGYNLDPRTNTAKVRPSYLKEHLVSGLEVFSRKDIPDHILTLSNPAPWNKLYRRDFVKTRDLRFMSTRSANDVYFTKMAFVLADRISCVNEPLVYYRVLSNNSIQSRKFKAPLIYLSVIEKLYGSLKEAGLYHEVEKSFCDYIVEMLCYELRPYANRADRISIYQQVFAYPTLIESGVLDHEPGYYAQRNDFNYLKGLQSAVAFYERHSRPRDDRFQILSDTRTETDPFISVIVPVYNKEEFITDCIGSVFSQTFTDYELILVDDGSTDSGVERMLSAVGSRGDITLCVKENGGPSSARNLGIRLARGKYLLYVDADDMLTPDALETLIRNLEGQDLLYFNCRVLYDEAEAESEFLHAHFRSFTDYYSRKGIPAGTCSGPELFDLFIRNEKYFPSPVLQIIRKDFLLETGVLFPEGIIHEDNPYTFKTILQASSATYLDRELYLRRVHNDSIMTARTGPENVYGYLKSYLEMRGAFFRQIDEPGVSAHQSAVYQALQAVMNGMRKRWRELPDEQRGFYLGMSDEEKIQFESMVIDYCKKEKEADDLKKKDRSNADKTRSMQKELDQTRDKARTLQKDLDGKTEEVRQLKAELKKAAAEKEKERAKLAKIKRSSSYKLGRLLTWPFRKLRSIFKKG